jgi:hypothetical protein
MYHGWILVVFAHCAQVEHFVARAADTASLIYATERVVTD